MSPNKYGMFGDIGIEIWRDFRNFVGIGYNKKFFLPHYFKVLATIKILLLFWHIKCIPFYREMFNKKLLIFSFSLFFFSFPSYAFVFFFDDMNTSLSDSIWQSGGANNEWGRGSAYNEICWATDIDGGYGKDSDQWLRTKNPIDLANAISAHINFDSLLYLGSGDNTYLEISTDSTHWDTLLTYGRSQAHNSWQHKGPIDISSYKGNSVYIRYRLQSNHDNSYSRGWYIDNVKVEGKLVPEPLSLILLSLGLGVLGLRRKIS